MMYSDEQIERAKAVPIARIAKDLGYTVLKLGRYYKLKEIDSIRIYPKKNTYFRFSDNTGGDAIKFAENIGEMSFQDAVRFILGEDPEVPEQKPESPEPEPAVQHFALIPLEVIEKFPIDAVGVYAKLRKRMNWDAEPKEYKLPRHSAVSLYRGQACVGIRGEFSKETGLTREKLDRMLRGFQEAGLILITRVGGQCSVVTFTDYAEPQTIREAKARIEKEALEKELNSADPWQKSADRDTTFDTTKTLIPTTKTNNRDTTFDPRTKIKANKGKGDIIPKVQSREYTGGQIVDNSAGDPEIVHNSPEKIISTASVGVTDEGVTVTRQMISEVTRNPKIQFALLEILGDNESVIIPKVRLDEILSERRSE